MDDYGLGSSSSELKGEVSMILAGAVLRRLEFVRLRLTRSQGGIR
jgi:hypothetical protein